MTVEALKKAPLRRHLKPATRTGETVYCSQNWQQTEPALSVLVPTHKDSADALMSMLSLCEKASLVEIIIYDDGSQDQELTRRILTAIDGFPGAACLITATQNKGRSEGRNRLEMVARSDWLLFLDADMVPDDGHFIERYLETIRQHNRPLLVIGGFSLLLTPHDRKTELHRAQSERSECIPAIVRDKEPGRYVFTSNVLAHKDIMQIVPFDPEFSGWGWEDVDWGIRASRRFPVIHIENTATHLGLDTPQALMKKYGQSAANFWLVADRHPDEIKTTPLYKMANIFRKLPAAGLIKGVSRLVATLPGWCMPLSIRLMALKMFRAATYGSERHAR